MIPNTQNSKSWPETYDYENAKNAFERDQVLFVQVQFDQLDATCHLCRLFDEIKSRRPLIAAIFAAGVLVGIGSVGGRMASARLVQIVHGQNLVIRRTLHISDALFNQSISRMLVLLKFNEKRV